MTPPRTRDDLVFYERFAFMPNPKDPVDGWCQLPFSSNLSAIKELLLRYELGAEGRVVLDPFCGAGSTLLAAALLDRRSAGCDLDALAVAVTVLKLRAPVLAETQDWAFARRVAGAVTRARGVDDDGLLTRIIADCERLRGAWAPDRHAVAHVNAIHGPDVVAAHFDPGTVDVFCSPPHGSGRPSLPADESPGALLDRAPAPYLRGLDPEAQPESATVLQALASCVSRLRRAGALGRVVVEFERSASRPRAAEDLVDALAAVDVHAGEIITLYRGAPDGVHAVIDGGIVVAG